MTSLDIFCAVRCRHFGRLVQVTLKEKFSLKIIRDHIVGRVLSFFAFSPVIGIGTPPTPHPQASVPPLLVRGEGHNPYWERGWESPNSDEGTYTVVLCIYIIYVLCVRDCIHLSNIVNPPIEYIKLFVKIVCCTIRSIVNLPIDYYLYCIHEMIRYVDHVRSGRSTLCMIRSIKELIRK
jgi:hypothetical protein